MPEIAASANARSQASAHASSAEATLDPKLAGRVRLMMLVSGLTTMIAIAAVVGVIGYRMMRGESAAVAGDATAMLPKGARVIATGVAGDRLLITLDIGGATEVHVFDARTFKPAGRLRFAVEP